MHHNICHQGKQGKMARHEPIEVVTAYGSHRLLD
jgi:hypothetical protein